MITLQMGRDTSWIYDAVFEKLSKQQIEDYHRDRYTAEELNTR